MKTVLKHLAQAQQGYVELRHHRRVWNYLRVLNGRVDFAKHTVTEGIGIRTLVEGSWGFAATPDCSEASIGRAIATAQSIARTVARRRDKRQVVLASSNLATGDVLFDGYEELTSLPIEEKLGQVVRFERDLAHGSQHVVSSRCYYSEILEEKTIVTTDGTCASLRLAQPEIALNVVVEKGAERTTGNRGAGVNGGWQTLLRHPSLANAAEETVKTAVELLSARYPESGAATVILAPPMVGLLAHEAIGHIVEADSMKAGTVAQGKLGKRVGSELVTVCDSGMDSIAGIAVGTLPFDDEGVAATTTVIIDSGILRSYLHNRQTAAEFGVEPTGNARAWLFHDEPRIRMRNTYLRPGEQSLDDMIAGLEDGYLADGRGDGQADANGQFMFETDYLWRIRKGKRAELLRDAALSGVSFDVLGTVDAISEEFRWDMGTGYCGKGQPAKVDGGGPYVRCRLSIGGRSR